MQISMVPGIRVGVPVKRSGDLRRFAPLSRTGRHQSAAQGRVKSLGSTLTGGAAPPLPPTRGGGGRGGRGPPPASLPHKNVGPGPQKQSHSPHRRAVKNRAQPPPFRAPPP